MTRYPRPPHRGHSHCGAAARPTPRHRQPSPQARRSPRCQSKVSTKSTWRWRPHAEHSRNRTVAETWFRSDRAKLAAHPPMRSRIPARPSTRWRHARIAGRSTDDRVTASPGTSSFSQRRTPGGPASGRIAGRWPVSHISAAASARRLRASSPRSTIRCDDPGAWPVGGVGQRKHRGGQRHPNSRH